MLISQRKRCTGSLGGFTQFRIGSVMTHIMGKKKKDVLFFVSNSIFFFILSSSSLSSLPFSLFLSHFFLYHVHPALFLCFAATLSHTHYISFSFCSFFIYIMGGLDECCDDCVQGEEDNSYLYSYLGRIQRGKIFTGFV